MGPEILIVGDRSHRGALIPRVQDLGYTVTPVRERELSGRVAASPAPAAVLICLGEADAAALVAAARRGRDDVPVVIFGALGGALRDLADVLELGADHFLAAPVGDAELTRVLAELAGPGAPDDDLEDWPDDADDGPVRPLTDYPPGGLGEVHRSLEILAARLQSQASTESEPDALELDALGLDAVPDVDREHAADAEALLTDPESSDPAAPRRREATQRLAQPARVAPRPAAAEDSRGAMRGEDTMRLRAPARLGGPVREDRFREDGRRQDRSRGDATGPVREDRSREDGRAVRQDSSRGEEVQTGAVREDRSERRGPGPGDTTARVLTRRPDEALAPGPGETTARLGREARRDAPARLEHDTRRDAPARLEHDTRRDATGRLEHDARRDVTARLEHDARRDATGRLDRSDARGPEDATARLGRGDVRGSDATARPGRGDVRGSEAATRDVARNTGDATARIVLSRDPLRDDTIAREEPGARAATQPGMRTRDATWPRTDPGVARDEPAKRDVARHRSAPLDDTTRPGPTSPKNSPEREVGDPSGRFGSSRDAGEGTARLRAPAARRAPSGGERIGGVEVVERLWQLHARRHHGRLTVGFAGGASKQVWWRRGEPVYATSTLAADGLLARLQARGLLARTQLAAAAREIDDELAPSARRLVAAGLLKPREQQEAVRDAVARIVESLCGDTAERWQLDADAPPFEVPGDAPLLALLAAGVRRGRDQAGLRAHLSEETALRLEVDDVAGLADELRWPGADGWLDLLDGSRSLARLVDEDGLDADELWAVGVVLLAAGLAVAVTPDADAALVEIDHRRISERLALARDSDYFALLGLHREASRAEILRAHDDLSRTFGETGLEPRTREELADELTELHAALDEAREVLLDEALRAAYLAHLDSRPSGPEHGEQ